MTDTGLNSVDLAAVGVLTECCIAQPGKAKTTWAARIEWTGGFTSKAYIRDFKPIESDEPSTLGGKNTSPNPVEQYLASLGNCLSVGYAAALTAKGIAIKKLEINVDGDLNLQTFLGIKRENAGFETIRVHVTLDADADADVLKTIHENVTGTSPVGHSVTRAVPVEYFFNQSK